MKASPESPAPRIRRARRNDYERLAGLGRWPGVEAAPRQSRRRFRNVLRDLAHDLYVAEREGAGILGYVAVSSSRVLALGGRRAVIDELVVDDGAPDRDRVTVALLELAVSRARSRRIVVLEVAERGPDVSWLEAAGFERTARGWSLCLEDERSAPCDTSTD